MLRLPEDGRTWGDLPSSRLPWLRFMIGPRQTGNPVVALPPFDCRPLTLRIAEGASWRDCEGQTSWSLHPIGPSQRHPRGRLGEIVDDPQVSVLNRAVARHNGSLIDHPRARLSRHHEVLYFSSRPGAAPLLERAGRRHCRLEVSQHLLRPHRPHCSHLGRLWRRCLWQPRQLLRRHLCWPAGQAGVHQGHGLRCHLDHPRCRQ